MSAIDSLIMKGCEVFGFEYQQAFTIALATVVTRRRNACNETQQSFWMSVATDEQKREAHEDAMTIIQLGLHLP